ncbi:hypothetical protein BC828DRAFT_8812 [Blastocladiella britannica]|nr:hypothetical protein BC828DRAFT_8812 [Blastocladiella britannica]
MDPILLTLGQVSLYRSDLASLASGGWLNDSIIALFFEVIEEQQEHSKVGLIRPAIVRLLHNLDCESARSILGHDHELYVSDVLVVPVNDHYGREGVGGSHWTTLIYHRASGQAYHFDSNNGSGVEETSNRAAIATSALLAQMLQWTTPIKVRESRCPQQSNGYDCGVAVVAVARTAVKIVTESGTGDPQPLINAIEAEASPLTLAAVRERMQDEVADRIAARYQSM